MVLFPAPAGPSMAMISLREEDSLIRRTGDCTRSTETRTSTQQGLEFCNSRLLWQTPCGSNEHVWRNRGGWDKVRLWGRKRARGSEKLRDSDHVSLMDCGRSCQIPAGKIRGQVESG